MTTMDQIGTLLSQYNVPAAFWVNIQLTFWAAIGAFLIGTALGLFRVSPVPSLQWLGASYVTLVRNTPLTVIMLFLVLGVGPAQDHAVG